MKLNEAVILNETPLPPEWDESIYNDRVPFAQRVRYAKERAEQIGRGSSRVVFTIPYQGRETALKIALNRKGAAQNAVEAEILSDGYHGSRGVVIPIIDYDEANPMPTWVHTEKADPIRSKKHLEDLISQSYAGFETDGKVDLYDIESYLKKMRGDRDHGGVGWRAEESISMNVLLTRLTELVLDYDLAIGDVVRKSNWGVYQSRPVLVDIGANRDVIDQFYRRR